MEIQKLQDVKGQVDNTAVQYGDILNNKNVNPITQGCAEKC